MPRGGHRGILFAVSGRALTAFGRRRRRGLYHHCTNEIFRPAWGPVRQPPLLMDAQLPNWASDTLSPAEKLPPKPQYSRDARSAWPQERSSFLLNMYRRNVKRYFHPAAVANDDHVRNYIYEVLEPSHRKCFSGIGVDFMRQSEAWSSVAPMQEASANPFPHVNESASLVRNLGLADVLHTKSNHRLARRAHPKWYAARYRKFMDKKRLQEKLRQLKIETGA
ncbi:hypothetical protein, conserved [Babesia ovata]|uniref:Uncharacterized protein n=1 Tax=Babesia ovata TaxID=189622 RepID=A0A2H6KI19_9APIC|nr:uncharacterized protein BOVATA_041310 [Babesia ovata]GBE62638.1 hypothetical protein, conserved [Babesia ovata]